MDRTVWITVAGHAFPMRNTLGATRRITEKFGGISKIAEYMDSASDDKKLEALVDIIEILIAQGCAYKNLFEKGLPAQENALVVNGEYVPIQKDALEVGIGLDDTDELMEKITECFNAGSKKTIASQEKETKNGVAM